MDAEVSVGVQNDYQHPNSGRTRDVGRSRRTFKNATTQTTDAVFVRSQDNADSSEPTVDKTKKKLACWTKEKTMDWAVIELVKSLVLKPPRCKNKNNLPHMESGQTITDIVPRKNHQMFSRKIKKKYSYQNPTTMAVLYRVLISSRTKSPWARWSLRKKRIWFRKLSNKQVKNNIVYWKPQNQFELCFKKHNFQYSSKR